MLWLSRGSRRASMIVRSNSGNSSRNRTPLCASDISPGAPFLPPPRIAVVDALWCGARNGRKHSSVSVFFTTVWSLIVSSFSLCESSGSRECAALAKLVLPVPGGPVSSILWRPARATVRARLAFFCPRISSKIGSFASVDVFFTTYDKGLILHKFFKYNHNCCRFLTGIIVILSAKIAACFAF